MKTVAGVDLAMQMFEHSTEYGCEYNYGRVMRVEVEDNVRKVICDDGSVYTAYAIILATGTVEKKLGLENEERLTGRGISYCAVCDGAFYKEKVVTVIGGGNSALEEALYLTQFASHVRIVIRRDVFRAEPHIQDLVSKHPKIEVITKSIPTAYIEEDGKISGVVLTNVDTKEKKTYPTSAVFPYIGSTPATQAVAHLKVTDSEGYLIVNEKMETSVPGVYGAGDVCSKNLRQIVTAVGDGAVAAQMIFHYIQELNH
jgi:thioredoxin reductase (NADPH)